MIKECKIITKKEAIENFKITREIMTVCSDYSPEKFYFVNKHGVPACLDSKEWVPVTVCEYDRDRTFEDTILTWYRNAIYSGD